MNKLLSILNLNKTYYSLKGEIKTLNNINLDIYKNEFVSIIGPSGCGKSTILNIISGLDEDYNGTLKNLNNISISYMSQEDSLFPWLSVYENAIIGLKIQKKLTKDNLEYIKYLLTKYGLKDFIYTKINNLSGGMKQRVALIRTISLKPDLILLDEPFSALDYQTRLKVSDDIYNILKNENITTIMVTHDIAEAISMSDRVIVLTNRPAKIKNIYNIKIDNQVTPTDKRKSKEFNNYFEKLWKDIDYHE